MRKELVEKVKQIIKDYCYPDQAYENEFGFEIHCDYRDELSDDTIIELCEAKNPYEAFTEKLDDWAVEYEWSYAYGELSKDIESYLTEEELEEWDMSEFTEQVSIYWYYPEEHFNREVKVNIMLDVGNGNYDFTCDHVLDWYGGNNMYGDFGTFRDESSILWLAKQQGKEDILKSCIAKEINDDEYIGEDGVIREPVVEDKFCKSVIEELQNVTSHMVTLTFLVSMPLFDLFKINENINAEKKLNDSYYYNERKGTGSITLDKNTECGLFDYWNGSGSLLGIELDKEVILPYKAIHSCQPDGYYKWDVDNVYGLIESCWKETVKKVA